MKTGIVGLLLLFMTIASYAELKCDAPEFADNPAMKDSCVKLQEALEEKVKEKIQVFTEAIDKARARLSEGKLREAAANAQAAAQQGQGAAGPNATTPAMGGNAPAQPVQTLPTRPVAPPPVTPSTPVTEPATPTEPEQQAQVPNKTPRSNTSSKSIYY